jgi:hypothetical protein
MPCGFIIGNSQSQITARRLYRTGNHRCGIHHRAIPIEHDQIVTLAHYLDAKNEGGDITTFEPGSQPVPQYPYEKHLAHKINWSIREG